MSVLYFQPIGFDDISLIHRIADRIGRYLRVDVRVGRKIELPPYSFNSSRGQYKSLKIMDYLIRYTKALPNNVKIIGIVDVDLYSPFLTFVFGEAQFKGKVALVSTARLNGIPDRSKIENRLFKEILHEIGHLFGLKHCHRSSCVMAFSRNPEEIDMKGKDFCGICFRKFMEAISEYEREGISEKMEDRLLQEVYP